MECDKTLLDFTSEQLVLALVDRDLSSVSEDLKSIVLYQIGTSLNESLQAESKTFAGISMNLTSFEKVDPEKFITSDDRCLPVINLWRALLGNLLAHFPRLHVLQSLKSYTSQKPQKNEILSCVVRFMNVC